MKVKAKDLIHDDKNFNKGSEVGAELIKKSFSKFGAGRSILLDKNNRIIAGNKSVEFSGIDDVQIVESDGTKLIAVKRTDIDLDTPLGREMALADNASAKANIVFDAELIEAEVGVAIAEEWGVEMPKVEPEVEEDDFDVDSVTETDIVLGDFFEIGEHRLLCGDSTDSDAVARLMNGENPSLILSDPPYGIGISGQKKSIAKNPKHNRKFHEDREWDEEVPNLSLLLSFECDIILWGGNYFIDYITKSKGWICWSKGQDGQLTMSDGELAWTNIDKPLRIVTVNRANLGKTNHPTQKPIEVMNFSIKYSDSNGLISDFFLGSGTTMVASHQLKRKCYGMELDPKYCQVIIDRMKKLDPTLIIKRNGVTI